MPRSVSKPIKAPSISIAGERETPWLTGTRNPRVVSIFPDLPSPVASLSPVSGFDHPTTNRRLAF